MMTCDGLVCFPEEDRINVLNPSTRQLRRFCPGPGGIGWRNCVLGFGRDKVTGSYKVVRMCFEAVEEEWFGTLDVQSGEWSKLSPPPYKVDVGREPEGRKPVCVNGSIYWLSIWWGFKILALNLHTLEFHDVSVPTTWVTYDTHIVNLQDRLAIVNSKTGSKWKLVIWTMNTEEEIWSKTYSISLAVLAIKPWRTPWRTWRTLKLGDVVFCDNHKRLFKYHPKTNEIRCLSSDICVISPYLENLVPLPPGLGHYSDLKVRPSSSSCGLLSTHPGASSGISKLVRWITFGTLDIVFITLFIVGIRTTSSLCSSLYRYLV